MYRKMGMLDCIATSPAHYVELAVRVATEPDYADSLRRRIFARNHVLFEDARVVGEFERFFAQAMAEAQRSSLHAN